MEEILKNILTKITSYNLFNNLLPGIIFIQIFQKILNKNILTDKMLENLFIYYFAGIIISRIGSLIIEDGLKTIKYIEFIPYNDYIEAEKKNEKLKTLIEINNMYRTFSALFLTIIVLYLFKSLSIDENCLMKLFIIGLFILFLLSYKKQVEYIKKNVYKTLENDSK